jgi:TPP-dependent pyruvate/acetoin dehydrogenase alpha subunit
VPTYRARLTEAGVPAADLDAIEAEADGKIAAAEAEAREAPEPSPDVIETQVWADGGSAWRN